MKQTLTNGCIRTPTRHEVSVQRVGDEMFATRGTCTGHGGRKIRGGGSSASEIFKGIARAARIPCRHGRRSRPKPSEIIVRPVMEPGHGSGSSCDLAKNVAIRVWVSVHASSGSGFSHGLPARILESEIVNKNSQNTASSICLPWEALRRGVGHGGS